MFPWQASTKMVAHVGRMLTCCVLKSENSVALRNDGPSCLGFHFSAAKDDPNSDQAGQCEFPRFSEFDISRIWVARCTTRAKVYLSKDKSPFSGNYLLTMATMSCKDGDQVASVVN